MKLEELKLEKLVEDLLENLWDRSWCGGCGGQEGCQADCPALALWENRTHDQLAATVAQLDNDSEGQCVDCGGALDGTPYNDPCLGVDQCALARARAYLAPRASAPQASAPVDSKEN